MPQPDDKLREALTRWGGPGQPAGKSEGLDDAGPIPGCSSPRRQDPDSDLLDVDDHNYGDTVSAAEADAAAERMCGRW